MSVKIRRDVNVGQNIRELRRKAHLTQEQVVELLNERRLRVVGVSILRRNAAFTISVCQSL